MIKTKFDEVIIPELFTPFVIRQTKDLSNIINSGIAQSNILLDELISRGGSTINMPFLSELSGDAEVLSEDDKLIPEKISSKRELAPVLVRGKAWSSNELAGALAGNDPMTATGEMVAKWWNVQEQRVLIAIL